MQRMQAAALASDDETRDVQVDADAGARGLASVKNSRVVAVVTRCVDWLERLAAVAGKLVANANAVALGEGDTGHASAQVQASAGASSVTLQASMSRGGRIQ